jgi:deoxyhypusine synthase
MSHVKTHSRHLTLPTEPFRVDPDITADELLARMERISFQGRNLSAAHRVWQRMLEPDITVFLGLAGALTAGGLRMIVSYLIEHRFVDCLVSTGANLYHDLHETRGYHHFVGTPRVDDADLQEERIDRVYDTYAREDEFAENDEWIAAFARTLEPRPYTSREFLNCLGGRLWEDTGADGILTAAYRANVPIFCPAIADSSIGMGLAQARHDHPETGQIDVIGDIIESANVVIRGGQTASVVLGGGTPKNFINQAIVEAEYYSPTVDGHRYAIQIVTDAPHFGGASGSTLDEATSWGKVATDARHVTIHADVTVALPLLTTALAKTGSKRAAARGASRFDVSGMALIVDGRPVERHRFEQGR